MAKKKPKAKKPLSPRQKALLVAEAAHASKGEDLAILNVSKVTSFADYFIITHGNSSRHVSAIADNIVEAIKKCGSRPFGMEGNKEAQWILIDWGEAVAHIFQGSAREFYELEKLWADARRLKYPPVKRARKTAAGKKK